MAYGNKRTILFVQTQNETYIIDVHDPKNPQITAILTAANTVKLSSNETFAILGTDHGLVITSYSIHYTKLYEWSTPKNPSSHARDLKKHVDGCIKAKQSYNFV